MGFQRSIHCLHWGIDAQPRPLAPPPPVTLLIGVGPTQGWLTDDLNTFFLFNVPAGMTGKTWRDIRRGPNGHWCAVGNNDAVMHSVDDGKTWIIATYFQVPGKNFWSCAWDNANSRWLLLGGTPSDREIYSYIPSIGWVIPAYNNGAGSAGEYTSIAWSAIYSLFFMTTTNNTSRLWSSTNGASWSTVAPTADYAGGGNPARMVRPYGSKLFNARDGAVAVMNSLTPTGSAASVPGTPSMTDIAYSPLLDRYIAVSGSTDLAKGAGNVLSSPAVENLGAALLNRCFWLSGVAKFVAFYNDLTWMFTSPDGLTFTSTYLVPKGIPTTGTVGGRDVF